MLRDVNPELLPVIGGPLSSSSHGLWQKNLASVSSNSLTGVSVDRISSSSSG